MYIINVLIFIKNFYSVKIIIKMEDKCLLKLAENYMKFLILVLNIKILILPYVEEVVSIFVY